MAPRWCLRTDRCDGSGAQVAQGRSATTDGKREIIGLSIGDSEVMPFLMEFLRCLVKRGLKSVKVVGHRRRGGVDVGSGAKSDKALKPKGE